jgi:hypothetical protein
MKTTQAATARTLAIEIGEVKGTQAASAIDFRMSFNGTVSAATPLTSFMSSSYWFLGNRMQLSFAKDSATKETCLELYILQGSTTTFKKIVVRFQKRIVATISKMLFPFDGKWSRVVWKIDAKTAKIIKAGNEVEVRVYA